MNWLVGVVMRHTCVPVVTKVCGMEILASRYGGRDEEDLEGVCDGPQWSKFLQSLIEKGYFMVRKCNNNTLVLDYLYLFLLLSICLG